MVFFQILKYKNKKNITSAYNLEDFQCLRKVPFDLHTCQNLGTWAKAEFCGGGDVERWRVGKQLR